MTANAPASGKRCEALVVQPGVWLWKGRLDAAAQKALLQDVAGLVRVAPFFTPRMPRSGRPFSVRMTNAGPLGWLSDQARGYRYEPRHPETGQPWPSMPQVLLRLWDEATGYPAPPEACLVNYYAPSARMGLHRDSDEAALDAPVLSVSLGDSAHFRIGGTRRGGTTTSLRLDSGDLLVFSGPARLAYHGIDRLLGGSSRLLAEGGFPDGGRINLTLRRVNPA